jgi:hypothetical protein
MRSRIRLGLGAAAATVMIGTLGWTLPQQSQRPSATPTKPSPDAPAGRILWQFETGG